MKRTTSIVLFASIFAVAVGTLGLSGSSATSFMVSAVPQSQESVNVLGHVEYKLVDGNGNIKAYMQNDNIVVSDGEDCAAEYLFGATTSCNDAGAFTNVAIGNHTSTLAVGNSTLSDVTDDLGGDCATATVEGEMARINPGVTNFVASTGSGASVEIDTSATPFTFDSSNATTVYDSGLFNKAYTAGTTICLHGTTEDAQTDWDMFATQNLSGTQGIAVTDGDSLSVKWTITVG